MSSINRIQDSIIKEMSERKELTDKYQYLIKMAKQLNVSSGDIRTDDNLIKGCQSSVWIKADFNNNKVYLYGDSDSMITKGMLALVIKIFNGQSPDEILKADLYFLNKTGLSAHLSPSRSDGLSAIIKHILSIIKR